MRIKKYKNLYGSKNIMNFDFEIDKQTHSNIDASTYFVMWVDKRLNSCDWILTRSNSSFGYGL
jgi:hypothetical protein